MRVWIVALSLLVACSESNNPNCERAVKHVFHLTVHPKEGMPKPAADEQAMIDRIQARSLERCNSEGLSDAQRDCILAAKALDERDFLMCPALVAKHPSWIIAPIGHPELLDPSNWPKDEHDDK